MEAFILGDNQIIQNNPLGLLNDEPLPNFLNQFCQEFKYLSTFIHATTSQKLNTRGQSKFIAWRLEKPPVTYECIARICLQRAESFDKRWQNNGLEGDLRAACCRINQSYLFRWKIRCANWMPSFCLPALPLGEDLAPLSVCTGRSIFASLHFREAFTFVRA